MMNTKIIPVLILILTLSLIPQVYADSESDVNLMDLPKQLTERLGLPSSGDYFAGKILASCILLALFLLPTLFLCSRFNRDVLFPALFVGFLVLGFCIALGWLPYWFLLVICLIIAFMFSGQIRSWISGGGR